MSVILYDGFDDGLIADRWNASAGVNTAASSAYNRFGKVMELDGDYETATYTIPSGDEDDEIYLGFWMNWQLMCGTAQSQNNGSIRFSADSGATHHIEFRATPSGEWAVYRGSTLLGTSDIIFTAANDPHYIEIKLILHDSTGEVEILKDGASVLTLTSQDTKNGGTDTEWDTIRFYNSNISSGFKTRPEIDDLYLLNSQGTAYNTYLGGVVMETLFPDGDGNHTDFTRNTGSTDWETQDEGENHDGDTTYLESSTDTDRSSFSFEALTHTAGDIFGVQMTAVMRNTGATDNVQLFTRVSATNYDSGDYAVPPAYGPIDHIWEDNPNTATDWTLSEINAFEGGVENVA